jgi:hypothetical protein
MERSFARVYGFRGSLQERLSSALPELTSTANLSAEPGACRSKSHPIFNSLNSPLFHHSIDQGSFPDKIVNIR